METMRINFKHPAVRLICCLVILAYLLSPLDVFPDAIPLLGRIDDIAVLLYGMYLLSGRTKKFGGTRPQQEQKQQSARTEHEKERVRPSQTPYETLGVSEGAAFADVTAKYRELAAKYHPDKVVHLGDEFQRMAHEKMIVIQKAYEELSARAGHS